MAPLLYLDTARLGQMTPAAKDAQLDFVRLSAEEPSSLYFEKFLRGGYSAWPDSYQQRFPGLRTWRGVAGLKQSLRRLAGAPDDWPVLLASRSLSLVHLAVSSMFRVCRNVLTTDLSWPTYQQAVVTKAKRTGNQITTVRIRDEILYRGWTADDVARHLATAFEEHQCDGLFLPAVDHLGIRLPIRKIVNRIRERSEIRFCFIDAAQAFCHVPLDECVESADFIVAGSHKWMGAYLPTGIGMFGRPRSSGLITERFQHLSQGGHLEDPLLRFSEQLSNGVTDGYSETANLSPVIVCAGAASNRSAIRSLDLGSYQHSISTTLKVLPLPSGEWQLIRVSDEMQSRIALLRSTRPTAVLPTPNDLRLAWLEAGTVVSAFADGVVRISLPTQVTAHKCFAAHRHWHGE